MKKFCFTLLMLTILLIGTNCYAASGENKDVTETVNMGKEYVFDKNASEISNLLEHGESVYAAEKEAFSNKLIETFPELEQEIRRADAIGKTFRIKKIAAPSEEDIIYRENKWISDEELVSIAFSEDGSYSAYSILVGTGSKKWIGGTTSSGSSYKNVKNATLQVSNSYYLHTITIYPISYSLVNGAYDSFIDTGIAVSPLDGHVTAYPVQMKETASSPAYAYYYQKNVFKINQSDVVDFQIKIEISNDNVRVYLFEVQI